MKLRLFWLYGGEIVLPSDSGAAAGPSSWASGVFDAAQNAIGDVVTELSSFTKFQKRVEPTPPAPSSGIWTPCTPSRCGGQARAKASPSLPEDRAVLIRLGRAARPWGRAQANANRPMAQ